MLTFNHTFIQCAYVEEICHVNTSPYMYMYIPMYMYVYMYMYVCTYKCSEDLYWPELSQTSSAIGQWEPRRWPGPVSSPPLSDAAVSGTALHASPPASDVDMCFVTTPYGPIYTHLMMELLMLLKFHAWAACCWTCRLRKVISIIIYCSGVIVQDYITLYEAPRNFPWYTHGYEQGSPQLRLVQLYSVVLQCKYLQQCRN